MTRTLKLGVAATSALGATYWYYKPTVVPATPYIPPPFVWDSIPKPVLQHLEGHDNALWKVGTTMVVGVAGMLAKGFMKASDTRVYGLDKFMAIVEDPKRTQGLITVSNHESVLDDPFLWGAMPLSIFFKVEKMRWVLGAADICYTTVFKSYFFACGKTLPAIRGGGVYQPGVDLAISTLNRGGWVHIYPEAKVSQHGKMIRFKWGIGRILMDMEKEAIVVPVWHEGMHLAKPLYETKLVHLGQPITLVFGDPIAYSDILVQWKNGCLSEREARIQITQRIYDALEHLESQYKSNTNPK